MWWAVRVEKPVQAIQDRWCDVRRKAGRHLIVGEGFDRRPDQRRWRSHCNKESSFLKTVDRCNVACLKARRLKTSQQTHSKGVDLES
jgi:hypothetical protein